MAGKKTALHNSMNQYNTACLATVEQIRDSLSRMPPDQGGTFKEEQEFCRRNVDPLLTTMIQNVRGLDQAINGLAEYIRKNSWNAFKKDARATADGWLRDARAYREAINQALVAIRDRHMNRLEGVRETRGLFAEILGE